MSSQLRVDKILPVDGAPTGGGGGIIQVKQTFKTDITTISANGSFQDISGLSVSITPKFSTSKIMIMFTVSNGTSSTGGTNGIRIVRDSTAVGIADASSSRGRATVGEYTAHSNTTNSQVMANSIFIDSPSTTSATTYKLQHLAANGGTSYINRSGEFLDSADHPVGTSHITVMEVSG